MQIKNLCPINTIKNNSFSVIMGESGCGKSTLAKGITKLVPHKSGDIIFNNKSIFSHNSAEKKDYPSCVQMIFLALQAGILRCRFVIQLEIKKSGIISAAKSFIPLC